MIITLTVSDELLERAAALTGEVDESALVRMGLVALVTRESACQLAHLGGSDVNAEAPGHSRT